MRHTLAALAVTTVVLSHAALASAQPSPQERAAAESLFREAKDLGGKGQMADACPKFAESQRLDPKFGTLIHLATCYEQTGRTASAWIEWTEAAVFAARAKQPDREKSAKEHAAALEARLSKLVMTVSPAPGLKISLDGRPIGVGMLGTPVPADPGEHLIEVSATDRKSLAVKVMLPEGPGTATVVIPALESNAPPPAAAPAPLVRPAPPAEPREDPTMKILGWGLVGVGVAGLGVGTVFGIRSASLKGDAERACPDKACTQDGLTAYEDGKTAATVSTIGFGAGLLAAGAGVTILLFGNGAAPISVTPAVSDRTAGLSLRGGF